MPKEMMSLEFENLENITKQLWSAANSRSICSLKLEGENGYRMVHTHGIFMSKQKKLTIVCWQKSGFGEKGLSEGYRNLALDRCENVLVLSRKFVKRRDFNPKDEQYGDWLFHI
jgi:hypothetical protein